MFKIKALPLLRSGYYVLSTEAVASQVRSVSEPQLPNPGRASPGGVPRAGDDLVVIQEAAARQVPWGKGLVSRVSKGGQDSPSRTNSTYALPGPSHQCGQAAPG